MQIIEYLINQLRSSADFNSKVQVAPAAILWTDVERQWQSAMPLIKKHLPELFELGEYQPEHRIGPAIWIKCAIAGVLDEFELPKDRTPIIYLPGVSRKDLRAIEQCPDELRPLAELQYRGCWWIYNSSGRDWTVTSFLSNPSVGLELDVAMDQKTKAAVLNTLSAILESPVNSLKNKVLEAHDFYNLVLKNPASHILKWLNDSDYKMSLEHQNKWFVFKQLCSEEFGFSPDKSSTPSVLRKLCASEDSWLPVWRHFEDTAHNLPNLLELLMSIHSADIFADGKHYLTKNIELENNLAKELEALTESHVDEIVNKLVVLYKVHEKRKSWLWYRLNYSPWLSVLEQLVSVLEHTKVKFSGPSVEAMADSYKDLFWQADEAALLAMVSANDSKKQDVVAKILGSVYSPWLEEVTLNFQKLVRKQGYPGSPGQSTEINESTADYNVSSQVVFFVDGLRFDTSKFLVKKLEKLSISTDLKTNWSALPSLTATAKAAVTPVAELLSGAQDNDNFTPIITATGSRFSSYHLKKSLADKGWQYLEGLETGEPQGSAWVQTGDLDNMGHSQQMKMPLNIDAVLEDVVARIEGLLKAGWKNIRIVTDHGWLWVPNQLTEAKISKDIVKIRLARCAILKDNAKTEELMVPWYWNKNVSVAMAPGISGYRAGDYYNHGGLSLQECLTPVINIKKINGTLK